MASQFSEPTLVETPVVPIENVLSGGPSEDGKTIIIAIKLLDNQHVRLQMAHNIADRLLLALQQYTYIAQEMRNTNSTTPNLSAFNPGKQITPTSFNFNISHDGKNVFMAPIGAGIPPLNIVLPAEFLPALKRQFGKIEQLLKRQRKRHSSQ